MNSAPPMFAELKDPKLGPSLTLRGLANRFSLTEEDIEKKTESGTLLALPLMGSFLYPLFQFTPNGESLPRLKEFRALLPPLSTEQIWVLASWLTTPNPAFFLRTPAQQFSLKPERVLALAPQLSLD